MTKYFCTLFDSFYLFKGVVMLRTLKQHCRDAQIFVLCMDLDTQIVLEKLGIPDVICISLEDVEDEALLFVKPFRSKAEYCWTLSPCLPWYIFENYSFVDAITYLDADLCFYSSLDPLFQEIDDASIVIIEHRFPPQFQHMEIRGRFCVEWVGFRRNEIGLTCLMHWKNQCVEWCYHRLEEGRMGDQKYLDAWPSKYSNLHILQHLGAGVAPWNYSNYLFGCENGQITVNCQPLIFYHFHQFQIVGKAQFNRLSNTYKKIGDEPEIVYQFYESKLTEAIEDVIKIFPNFSFGINSSFKIKIHRLIQDFLPNFLKEFLKKFIQI